MTVSKKTVLKNILILPFNVLLSIPAILLWMEDGGLSRDIYLRATGIVFILSGIVLLFWTIRLFYLVGRGTLAPWDATSVLVVRGPYLYARNPMISGVLFVLFGKSLVFQSIPIWLLFIAFFCINHVYFIFKEEPDLVKRFGDKYLDYKSKVPRWLPNLSAYEARQ